MNDIIYQVLAGAGYHHPLHPAIAHLPVGLVFGGFLFAIIAFYMRQDAMSQTARHCMILALIALVPTVFLGYIDWRQYYAGAWLPPIKMKFVLALILAALLVIGIAFSSRDKGSLKTLITYALCTLAVVGLGFYGGELVFGSKVPSTAAAESQTSSITTDVAQGALVFNQRCAGCHYADRTDFKMGPGLKGLFDKEALYGSDWPTTEANVRKQIVSPFGTMPAYRDMPQETLDAMIAYLRTL